MGLECFMDGPRAQIKTQILDHFQKYKVININNRLFIFS